MGGFNWSINELFAWRGGFFFDIRKDRGVVGVFPIFNAGGSVRGCMFVYTHTHTHTSQMRYLDVSPGVGMRPRTPGGPKESRWTKSRHTHIRICVQSTHAYVYAKRRDEILDQLLFPLTYFFFRKRKANDSM